jgi:hypothetical protein
MRQSDTPQNMSREADIIAQPPFGSGPPIDPKQRLPVSEARAWLGIVVLVIGVVAGLSALLFDAAKLWLGGIGLLLIIASFWILGLHRLRLRPGHGRDPRKLYAHPPSNQALERTADRREDLLSMTSTPKSGAQLAVASGRSAFSR